MASNKNEISELSGYIKELIGEMRQFRGAMSNNASKTDDSGKSSKSDKEKGETKSDEGGIITSLIKGFTEIKNVGAEVAQAVGKSWGAADDAASKYVKTIGGSAKTMAKMRQDTINFVSSNSAITAGFNTSMAELVDLQIAYNKEVGRAIRMSHEQLKNIAAMNALIGSENAVKFAASFERFGLDVTAASKASKELFDEATRKGIVFEQLSNNFLNNIDLAQRYTFKGGIDGLRKMAEHSTSIRWDMQQTASFAEKVNNVEGAIKTGAQLSVLGGPFAQFSNPMGMLYQSLNDMEGLNTRVTKMFQNFGKWNSETNQVEVSAFNRMRIRAAAEAMGLDYGKTMDSIYAQGRKQHILSKMSDMSVDESIKEYASNVGQINRETGEAFVTINGQEKNVRDLTDADKTEIQNLQKTEAEDIKEIAQQLRSYSESFEGLKKSYEAQEARLLEESNVGFRIKEITQWFASNGALLRSLILLGVSVWGVNKINSWTGGNMLAMRYATGGGMATGAPAMASGMAMGAPMMRGGMAMGAPMMGGGMAMGAPAMGGGMAMGTPMMGMPMMMGMGMMGGGMPMDAGLPGNVQLTPQAKAELNKFQKKLDNDLRKWQKKHPNATVAQYRNVYEKQRQAYERKLGSLQTQVTPPPTATAAATPKVGFGRAAWNGVKQRWSNTFGKNVGWGTRLSNAGSVAGRGLMGYMMGDIAKNMIAGDITEEDYLKNPERAVRNKTLGGAAQGAITGAMALSFLGPFGMIAGGLVGGLVGGISSRSKAKKEAEKAQREERIRKVREEENDRLYNLYSAKLYDSGIFLRGSYTGLELKRISEGRGSVAYGSGLHKKMIDSGDGDVFNTLKYGKGGVVSGPSHAHGGVPTLLEGNEFVVRGSEAKKNYGLLDAINRGDTDNYIKSSQTKVLSNDIATSKNSKQDVNFSPLNANVGGTIKLDLGGYTKDIDGRQLLDNPSFTHYLTDVVTKQINLVDNRRFNKSDYFRKL